MCMWNAVLLVVFSGNACTESKCRDVLDLRKNYKSEIKLNGGEKLLIQIGPDEARDPKHPSGILSSMSLRWISTDEKHKELVWCYVFVRSPSGGDGMRRPIVTQHGNDVVGIAFMSGIQASKLCFRELNFRKSRSDRDRTLRESRQWFWGRSGLEKPNKVVQRATNVARFDWKEIVRPHVKGRMYGDACLKALRRTPEGWVAELHVRYARRGLAVIQVHLQKKKQGVGWKAKSILDKEKSIKG